MVSRKRIGLIYSYKEDWIAGTYYVLNIIKACKTLDDKEKPVFIILTNNTENYNNVKDGTDYPYLEFIQFPAVPNLMFRMVNRVYRLVAGKNLAYNSNVNVNIDFLYPMYSKHVKSKGLKKIVWIPDFQEAYLPHLFTDEIIARRKKHQIMVAKDYDLVVLSSKDAQSHFKELYPDAKANTTVLEFAVTHPDFSAVSFNELKERYGINNDYFFTPNQFWAHKNHLVVLEAMRLIKQAGGKVPLLLFSGKEKDFRNVDYVNKLKAFVNENGLGDNVIFLGFMDRLEQLCIMQNAKAIIQPSLFEGWSTVVEDAKALGKHIIVSNIPVHLEQVDKNCTHFDPKNADELMVLMQNENFSVDYDAVGAYDKAISSFARKFIDLSNFA